MTLDLTLDAQGYPTEDTLDAIQHARNEASGPALASVLLDGGDAGTRRCWEPE